MAIPLSVLDLVPVPSGTSTAQSVRNSLDLAVQIERLGFRRLWYAEHHNMPTVGSTTPELMIALAAERTEHLRIGSGGVMLPNHSPLKVAESFKFLSALHPGRIDLGIGRAPGTDPATAIALRGSRDALGAEDFPDRLSDLVDLGEGPIASGLRGGTITAVPEDGILPDIFLLGSGDFSARLAAQRGYGFGFAAHFSDLDPTGPMTLYRREFQPSLEFPRPYAILTLSVVTAPTEEEAMWHATSMLVSFARLRTGQRPILLDPEEAAEYPFTPQELAVANEIAGRLIVGTPDTVRTRIEALVERTQADEVMVSAMIARPEARLNSLRLLSEAFSLRPARV